MNEFLDMLQTEVDEWVDVGVAWTKQGNRLLHQAVKDFVLSENQLSIIDINTLLDKDVNIDTRNTDLATPLHVAVQSNMIELVELLVERGASLTAKSMHGATPLHNACRKGSGRIVAYLIREGSDKDALTHDGNTPLHHAVRFDRIDNIRILILAGANTRIKNDRGEHPMNLKCSDETKAAFKNAIIKRQEMDHI